jgi:hypothetical protein
MCKGVYPPGEVLAPGGAFKVGSATYRPARKNLPYFAQFIVTILTLLSGAGLYQFGVKASLP